MYVYLDSTMVRQAIGVKSAKMAKGKATKTTPAKVEAPAPVVEEVAAAPAEPECPIQALEKRFAAAMQNLSKVQSDVASIRAEFRALEKSSIRELKAAIKASTKKSKRRSSDEPRKPSGFELPTRISNELASFLKKPAGSEMARTAVTREINAYIRQHKLQDKDNGRIINPDKSLAKLLKIKGDDELTYFNLQRYMSPHFISNKAKA